LLKAVQATADVGIEERENRNEARPLSGSGGRSSSQLLILARWERKETKRHLGGKGVTEGGLGKRRRVIPLMVFGGKFWQATPRRTIKFKTLASRGWRRVSVAGGGSVAATKK